MEKGSTQLIRNTAADQLADVQKQHPDELFNLLGRVLPYLRAHRWDTRTAAARAIGGIVTNAEPFDPNADDASAANDSNGDVKLDEATIKTELDDTSANELLQLDTLDIALILQHGKKLLATAGDEYDSTLGIEDPSERLAAQKRTLTTRLGLAGEYLNDDLVDDLDFAASPKAKKFPSAANSKTKNKMASRRSSISSGSLQPAASDNLTASGVSDESGLSKRQLNQLKRKNKSASKSGANKLRVVDLAGRRPFENGSSPATTTPRAVRLGEEDASDDSKPEYFTLKREDSDDDTRIVSEFKGDVAPEKPLIQAEDEPGHEWPFEVMCDFLLVDLFDPNWEIRHGAAMGLREVFRHQGKGAGRRWGKSRHENDAANRAWLDDAACRLLCVLMLDRFGDYVSDTVVAPIRESVGQTLGALLAQTQDTTVFSIYEVLLKMIQQNNLGIKQPIWQVGHGGMIGLRYLVAVRKDLLLQHHYLMDGVTAAVTKGLAHPDDDIRSVSAATLIPITKELIGTKPDALANLIGAVWDCLSDMQDDLSASTGAIMDLLANLCSYPEIIRAMHTNAAEDSSLSISKLVPRLYYFFRHTITSVRSAVLRALNTFLKISDDLSELWNDSLLLRLIFQNILLERDLAVLNLSYETWNLLLVKLRRDNSQQASGRQNAIIPLLLEGLLQPIGQPRRPLPMNTALFIKPSGQPMSVQQTKSKRPLTGRDGGSDVFSYNTDGHLLTGDVQLVGLDVLLRTKIYGAQALGSLIALQDQATVNKAWIDVTSKLSSTNSSTQLIATTLLEEIARHQDVSVEMDSAIVQTLQTLLDSERTGWYSDIMSSLQVARGQCHALIVAFRDHAHVAPSKLPVVAAVCQGDSDAGPNAFSLQDAERVVSTDFERLMKGLTPAQRITGTQYLTDARKYAQDAVEEARRAKEGRDVALSASVAAVLIALKRIPKKPSVVIRAVMDSIKTEDQVQLQQRSGKTLASLVEIYVSDGKKNVVDKVVNNLFKFCCVDTAESPEFHPNASLRDVMLSLRKEEDRKDHPDAARYERESQEAQIMRRGAKHAFEQLLTVYGPKLPTKLPVIISLIEDPLMEGLQGKLPKDILRAESDVGQSIIDAISMLRTLAPSFDQALYDWIRKLIPLVGRGLRSELSVIRYASAKCYATLCSVMPGDAMTSLVEDVLPEISNPLDLHVRQGITECIYHLIHIMEDKILPYVIFLIVPVLGRMSDANEEVRLLATTSFATLVKLVPLEEGIPDPPGMSTKLLEGRERERKFMSQMLDPKKADAFEIPVAIKAELRPYQQDGVNWLAFLKRFNLHGVLCDDMGLGKTLQTLCIVASDHYLRAQEFAKTGAPDYRPLPSLVVCPPTLSGHWQQEIVQYAPFLTAVAYVGPPADRAAARPHLETADIVITSYDICRNDNDVLAPITWNYAILDEGHLIKNPKAKITTSVKKIMSNHRLILSGTPIQNNVLELWSLFDFLMPGFLGTEKVFLDRFAKPIAASRNAKSSSKEQEAGALAIEALHKQVLPFLLRRLKEEVLNDLPPKILQNYYCDLSDLQRQLFDDFFRSTRKAVESHAGSSDKESKQHIFAALQYMRKLCNSPAMVVKEGHKQYEAIQKQLAPSHTSIRDAVHAPKLMALRDLLVDCGIGVTGSPNEIASGNYVSQHRALIFCQMKEMLDMVQNEVLGKLLPSAQFLRLDGSVEATKRQNIVNQFNTDPSYDCLLLTTSVGGLGLNLTGADTVIFVEHDWNPQKDIQAMDRAHRIGQKKVVNVYRLITRGTLEEKIMSLQRFKIDVASTVVNQQNAGLNTMETDQILDLFNLSSVGDSKPTAETGKEEDMLDEAGNVRKAGEKGWLGDIGELWDENQYAEEFNLDSFMHKMQK